MLVFDGRLVYSQGEDLEYVGSRECTSCHRSIVSTHRESSHALALQDVQERKEPILADFSQGEDLRTVTLPGETTARPFTADDIAYVVGAGQRVQRYLFAVDRHDLVVLPAEWNVETQSWQALPLAASWPDPAYDWEQNCAGCHVTGLDLERERWEEEGVQCEACHGPGSEHASLADDAGSRPDDSELAELRAAINPAIDPQTCGQCHARGTGADNRAYPVGFMPGTNLSDVFTLFSPDDTAHWYATGHAQQPNMQYNEWLTTGHAQSLVNLLGSGETVDATCLNCHSSDAAFVTRRNAEVQAGTREGEPLTALTAETAQYGVGCVSCHNPHGEAEQPAHLTEEPYTLCVSCHSDTAEDGTIHHPVQAMFEGLPLIEGIDGVESAHFIAEDGPDCVTCHMPSVPTTEGLRVSHTSSPILPGAALNVEGLTDTCSACHEDIGEPALLQQLIDDVQTDTRTRLDAARAAVTPTTAPWVTQALDFVEGDGSLGIHNYAYTDTILDAVFVELGLFDGGN
ncbi:MAG: cytochrome c3 family protein [Anaerolineae bacterium]